MIPLGCEGGLHLTVSWLILNWSTIPGAKYKYISLSLFSVVLTGANINYLPVSLDLPDTSSLRSLVSTPLVAVMVTVTS